MLESLVPSIQRNIKMRERIPVLISPLLLVIALVLVFKLCVSSYRLEALALEFYFRVIYVNYPAKFTFF